MLAILTSHPIQYQAPLWKALADEGRIDFEVWFLTDHAVKLSHDREFGKEFAWDRNLLDGYPHRFLPVRPGWRMDRFRGIEVTEPWAKLFNQRGVTRLWVEGWRFAENWAAIFAARRAGIEVWMRGETNDLRPRHGWRERVRRLLLGALFRRVQYFLCIGTANRRFYQSFGISDERLRSAPYCVDNEWFAEEAAKIRGQKSEIRRRWGIPDDAFCLLFCGKFIPKKRPMDLVLAVKCLLRNSANSKVHLLFVGSGELGVGLRGACNVVFDAENPETGNQRSANRGQGTGDGGKRTEVRREGTGDANAGDVRLSDQKSEIGYLSRRSMAETDHPSSIPSSNTQLPPASFAGFLNQGEIIRAYVAADGLVLPSDAGETWGLVVNEAMATGLPCLASDQSGCAADLVGPLIGKGVFGTGDIEAITAAIAELISNPVEEDLVRKKIEEHDLAQTVATVLSLETSLQNI